jgi:hypothetical protein
VNIVAPALAFEQKEPCMAVNRATNNVFVLWTDSRNVGPGKETEVWGFSNANAWTGIPIAVDAKGQNSPSVAVEQVTDNLHMAWTSAAPGNFDIFYATSLGLPSKPLAGTNVTQDPAAQTQPSIAVNGLGAGAQIYLVWQDARQPTVAGETDIYFADIRPGTVPPWTNILVNPDAPATSVQTTPRVGLDDAGRPLVVWTDTRLGGLNIFAAGATMAGPNIASDKTPVDCTQPAVREVENTDKLFNSDNDVRVELPANAMPVDAVISIAPLANPPPPPKGGFGALYEFGPSGLQFATPVTISIPHAAASCPRHAAYQAYYYDSMDVGSPTYPWSQKGITNVQHVEISSTLHIVRFQTTHFSTYTAAGTSPTPTTTDGSGGSSGGGGGGGCFIATSGYELPRDEVSGHAVVNCTGLYYVSLERSRQLNRIRSMRDGVLIPTHEGRTLVAWYYALSPYVATTIRHNETAKSALRAMLLDPLSHLSDATSP